ncbi:MAG: tetratricopeptide repeat protein [Candidatus Omnitrophica bacterium]|nr:tetratricopeptide repeat protein [Candidatus Omnitrophota bacterium]
MKKFLYFVIFFGLFFPASFIFAEDQPITSLLKADTAADAEKNPPMNIDFETYQRNIDDLYHIALMSTPNVDYGINSLIVDLNRKIAENPKNVENLMALGHVYRVLGQPAEANRFYEKALAIDPNNFHLNIFSALTHVQQEEFQKALDQLNHAVEVNPADSYAWLARGRLLMMIKNNEEAAKSFEKVLEMQPQNRQAAFGLSLVYQALGQRDKAFELLQKLQIADPKDLFIQYHLGALFFVDKKPTQALEYWEKIFKDGVRDVQFLFNLVIAYLQNGDGDKAELILNHLSFFFPRESDVEFLMAETYRQMEAWKEAERHYRLVLAEDPDYFSAYLGLANIFERQGKTEEGENILKQAEERIQAANNLQLEQQNIQQAREKIFELVSPNQNSPKQHQTV